MLLMRLWLSAAQVLNLLTFAPAIMAARSTGWIAFAGEDAPQSDLASWIKSQENLGRTYKAVGTEGGKDCKHYVYFDQTCYDREGNQMKAVDYLPNLLGIIASCNVTKRLHKLPLLRFIKC